MATVASKRKRKPNTAPEGTTTPMGDTTNASSSSAMEEKDDDDEGIIGPLPAPPKDDVVMNDDDDDEKLCRYCFEGEDMEEGRSGKLISPCSCRGGQKWVHLSCLRRWQRMVLVSQPTHPAFYTRDERHHICNVCKDAYTCPPPERHELMASFTGPEIAVLLKKGSIIAASTAFSLELESISPLHRRMQGGDHWVRSIYLITSVIPETGTEDIDIDSERMMEAVKTRIDKDMNLQLGEEKLKLEAAGSLEGVVEGELQVALDRLTAPAKLIFSKEVTCGDDHIEAVNFTRKMGTAFTCTPNPDMVRRTIDSAKKS